MTVTTSAEALGTFTGSGLGHKQLWEVITLPTIDFSSTVDKRIRNEKY